MFLKHILLFLLLIITTFAVEKIYNTIAAIIYKILNK